MTSVAVTGVLDAEGVLVFIAVGVMVGPLLWQAAKKNIERGMSNFFILFIEPG